MFVKFIAKLIELRSQFSYYPIKSIRMDNTDEFISKAFDDYCMTLGIKVEHLIPYVHTQNGLVESLIKHIKLIAKPMLQHSDRLTYLLLVACDFERYCSNSDLVYCIS